MYFILVIRGRLKFHSRAY